MYTIGFAIIMSMGPAQGSAAGTERMVAMTTDRQRIKELEKQLKAQRDEIAVYRVYFQACAESETDPGEKRFYEQLANAEGLESLSKLHCPF